MSQDLAQLRQATARLRADLTATNLALAAVLASLSPEQQRTLMVELARLSVRQEQTGERTAMQEAAAEVQQATDRLHQHLVRFLAARSAK